MTENGENLKAVDGIGAGLIVRPSLREVMDIIGMFHAEHWRDGEKLWEEDFENLVTTQGKNAMLDKFLDLGTAYSAVRVGLHTTVGNAASTYASPSPQVEGTSYSGNRGTPTFSAASAGSKATSSNVSFSITGTMTVTGALLVLGASINTPGDTAATAILFSSGSFSSSRAVISGDTLAVSYSLAL